MGGYQLNLCSVLDGMTQPTLVSTATGPCGRRTIPILPLTNNGRLQLICQLMADTDDGDMSVSAKSRLVKWGYWFLTFVMNCEFRPSHIRGTTSQITSMAYISRDNIEFNYITCLFRVLLTPKGSHFYCFYRLVW